MASSIERGVREVLARGFQDPRIEGLITVTGLELAADLSRVTISVTVFPAEKEKLTVHGLQSAAAYIRREVGDLVETHQLPKFFFETDAKIKKQSSLLRDLDRVRAELPPEKPATPEADTEVSQDDDEAQGDRPAGEGER